MQPSCIALPATRGNEVTEDVIDNLNCSLVWSEAENRLHIQKAILEWCLKKYEKFICIILIISSILLFSCSTKEVEIAKSLKCINLFLLMYMTTMWL